MDRKCITKSNFLYKCQNKIGNFIIRLAKFIQCKSVVKMDFQRQEDSNETICSTNDFLYENAQRIPESVIEAPSFPVSFLEFFPAYRADQEQFHKNIAEANGGNDAAGNETKDPTRTFRDFCWPCISAKHNIGTDVHDDPKQQDPIRSDFCSPCNAAQHLKSIDALVKQYAFKRKPMIPKHIETPKKPKEDTLPDSDAESVDEGDGPSFTSYIGRGQNVDHDDESFWPYFISAHKRKTCSGTCLLGWSEIEIRKMAHLL
jgi:hypothetical protein